MPQGRSAATVGPSATLAIQPYHDPMCSLSFDRNAVRVLGFAICSVALGCASTFAQVRLAPVVAPRLASPTFVTHAGDGSNRLFIVEQAGVVQVLQPGSATPSVFLDIR